jgi:hypothetical protein
LLLIGVVAALLTAGAVAGWAMSATFATITAAVEDLPALEISDMKKLPLEEFKRGLIGSYAVTGTDPSGDVGGGVLDIALAPSGALELVWDYGKNVGVGQIIGNVLAVASSTKGRTVILMMNINPDGSLSGKSSRRTDQGSKGTEAWKRT